MTFGYKILRRSLEERRRAEEMRNADRRSIRLNGVALAGNRAWDAAEMVVAAAPGRAARDVLLDLLDLDVEVRAVVASCGDEIETGVSNRADDLLDEADGRDANAAGRGRAPAAAAAREALAVDPTAAAREAKPRQILMVVE